MMTPKRTHLIAAAFALCAGPAAAQVELSAAFDAAHAAVKAVTTCDQETALEIPLDVVWTPADGSRPLELKFEYAGCEWTPRNDYLRPFTDRTYRAPGGYALTILTDEDSAFSEVLLSKDKAWIGKLGSPSNTALVSGNPVTVTVVDHEDSRTTHGRATLRNASKPLYPQLKTCESADWSKTGASAPSRDAGKPEMGWNGRGATSLVLLTRTAAYYYHEDCDICAEVTRCELSSGALSSAAVAHSVGCDDMKPYRAEPGVEFDACPTGR